MGFILSETITQMEVIKEGIVQVNSRIHLVQVTILQVVMEMHKIQVVPLRSP